MNKPACNPGAVRRWILASMALMALIALPAWSATPSLLLVPGQDGQTRHLVVEGQWAPRCLPSPANAWASGQDVFLELRASGHRCEKSAEIGFELRSAPIDLPPERGQRPRAWRLHLLDADSGKLLAFALQTSLESPIEQPESGLWWPESGAEFDTSGPGIGVQVEVQEGTVALNVSGYDERGAPTWWFGAAALRGATLGLPLSALHGGSGPFDKYAAPEQASSAGFLHVEWLGSARAVFWFTRPAADGPGIELRPVSMTRFSFGTRPGESWVGDWVLHRAGADGEASVELLRFEWLQGDAERFELLSDKGLRLACRRAKDSPQQAPLACRLLPIEAGEALLFADVGLDRMSTVQDQQRISLHRLR